MMAHALPVPVLAAAMMCREPVRDDVQLLAYRTCEPEFVIVGYPDVVLKPLGPEVWPAPAHLDVDCAAPLTAGLLDDVLTQREAEQ